MTPEQRTRVPRRGSWIAILLLVALLALVAFAYSRWSAEDEVDAVGSMITGLQKQNSLTVFSAQVATVTNRTERRAFGLLSSRQTAIIPATVEYRLDQSQLTPDRFRWDAQAQSMAVTLPGLTVTRPNLDMARAQFYRGGLPMGGEMRDAMARVSARDATRDAVRQASSAAIQKLARDAARDAMAQNLLLPLRAAGFDRATVSVRFADEPGGSDPSFLDASRPVADVLRDAERARTTPATTPSS